jgi:MraZ protein
MDSQFFSGSSIAKLDEKNRVVLRQELRYGLVENGKLEFTLALGFGGGLVIYRNSEVQNIISKFRKKIHNPEFQKFFTLFFSTLHPTTCDKLGRLSIPSLLKDAVGIKKEIVVAGVLNKIELWPKEVYDKNLKEMLQGSSDLSHVTEKAFALLNEEEGDLQSMIREKQSQAFATTDTEV